MLFLLEIPQRDTKVTSSLMLIAGQSDEKSIFICSNNPLEIFCLQHVVHGAGAISKPFWNEKSITGSVNETFLALQVTLSGFLKIPRLVSLK